MVANNGKPKPNIDEGLEYVLQAYRLAHGGAFFLSNDKGVVLQSPSTGEALAFPAELQLSTDLHAAIQFAVVTVLQQTILELAKNPDIKMSQE